MLESIPDTTN